MKLPRPTNQLALGVFANCALLVFHPAWSDSAVREDESTRGGALISAQDLATLTDLASLSISPDGTWAAFQTRRAVPDKNRYDIAWHVAAIDGQGATRRIANGGEPILATVPSAGINGNTRSVPPVWSRDGAWIVYLRKDDGRIQVWRSRLDGRRTEQITRNAGDVRTAVYSRDGRLIFFATESSRAQREAVQAVEGRSGFLYDDRFLPDYSALPIAMSPEQEAAASGIWAYEFAARRERLATAAERTEFAALAAPPAPQSRAAFRDNAARAPSGALAWTEARDPARQGWVPPVTLVAQPAAAKEPIVCPAAECTGRKIRGIWWRNENEIVFARGDGPVFQDTALYSWRPGAAAVRRILHTPRWLVHSSYQDLCAIALDRLVCFVEEADSPRRLVAIDLDTGAFRTLYDPNPQFARFDLGPPPQRLEIRTSSGAETYGYLVLPAQPRAGERLPLVIVTYRCSGFLRGGTGDEYPIYPFAAAGFAVLCFNIPTDDPERSATLSLKDYTNWARGAGDPIKHRIQDALSAAVAQLDAAGIVDRERVGLTGLSYGAETVHFALFNMPLTAAVASGPGWEPSYTFLVRPKTLETLKAFGLDSPRSARWDALAVSRNTDRVRAPLLYNSADHELINVLETVAALRSAGPAVEMHVFPDEYHIKWQPAHRLAIYNRNIDWMNFWLRGVESGLTGEKGQYERWHALRDRHCRVLTGPHKPWFCRHSTGDMGSPKEVPAR